MLSVLKFKYIEMAKSFVFEESECTLYTREWSKADRNYFTEFKEIIEWYVIRILLRELLWLNE